MPEGPWFSETLRGELLTPIRVELANGQPVEVASVLRRESRTDEAVAKAATCWAPNKVAIDFQGNATWEEYAIVRLHEEHGWWACWVKHWYGSREFCLRPGESTAVPGAARAVFESVELAKGGGSGGPWDVYAWRDGPLFIESKQYRSSDRLNVNQIAWLSAAVATGIGPSCFAVVSYEADPPRSVA